MKLDFVCIGAQKAGTTSLHDILNTHPDIYLPPRKEAQFFDINERYKKGLDFYFSNFFNTYQGEKYVGNINPNLQIDNRSIDRLLECFGTKLKVIFILRDPINRAYSHYLMSKKRGYEILSFQKAIEQEQYRIENPVIHKNYSTEELGHYEKNHYGYLYRSHYLNTLKHLYKRYPKENIKVISFEEFLEDKQKTIQDLLRFLEIPNAFDLQHEIKSNKASKPRSTIVRDFVYRPNILKKMVGKLFSKKTKAIFKKKIDSLNNKPLKKGQKSIDEQEKKLLYKTHFSKEIIEIEQLTKLSFSRWKK